MERRGLTQTPIGHSFVVAWEAMVRRDLFAHPDPAYRGVALWMLNDRLDPDRLCEQLAEIRAAGWGAVITRTFNGLRTPYLSDTWMEMLEVIVAEAARLGLKVWFQAGYMPSAIPELPSEMTHRILARRPKDEALDEGELLLAEDDAYRYVSRLQPHVIDLLNAQAVAAYVEQAYTETWLPRFGDHFGETIEAVWVDEPHFRPPHLPWTAVLPDRFEEVWGYDIRKHLAALFADYSRFMGVRYSYWRTVTEMLLAGYFEPVAAWCEAHDVEFAGHLMGEDTLNNQVGFTGAAMPCYAYMGIPGIDHLTRSLTWPTGKPFILTPQQCTSTAHQLGKRKILAEMYAVSSQGLTMADRKEIAEWLMVQGINLRCYHGAFYSLRGRRKRIYPPHLSHQQPWWPENRVIADYFARLSYVLQQGEPHADILVIHPVESAFCLYNTLTMTHPHDRTQEPEEVQALDTGLVALCEHLLSLHYDFDLGDEGLIAEHAEVRDDEIIIGRMRYRVVILPEMMTIRASTLVLLKAFAEQGGTILTVGSRPTRINGVQQSMVDLRAVLGEVAVPVAATRLALRRALRKAAPQDLSLLPAGGGTPAHVWVHRRHLAEGAETLLYLHNTHPAESVTVDLRVPSGVVLERWDLERGHVTQVSYETQERHLLARLTFAPLGSHVLRVRPAGEASDAAPLAEWVASFAMRPTRMVPVLQAPRIARHDPNALRLDTCRYATEGALADNREGPLPVLTVQALLQEAGYEGAVTLHFEFEVERLPPRLNLVIEDPDRYVIVVNGATVSYEGLRYWIDEAFSPIEITSHVRRGKNTIEMTTDFLQMPEARFSLGRLFETREGTELEAIYLTGEFGVAATPVAPHPCPSCVRLAPTFRLAAEPVAAEIPADELTLEGYPFYAGTISLLDTVTLPAPDPDERVVLALRCAGEGGLGVAALVKVFVNGAEAGAIAWPPYELEITPWVHPGENEIRVDLVTTLRNLLGPHHHPAGEPDQCWSWDYLLDPAWLDDEVARQEHWDDNYTVLSLGLGEGALVRYLKPRRTEAEKRA